MAKDYIPIEDGVLGEFPYAINENHIGFLVGYLGVPRSHPWYGRTGYDHDIEVHGGITYSQPNIIGEEHQLSYLRKNADAASYADEVTDEKTGITIPSAKPFAEFYQRRLDAELESAGLFADYPIEGFPYDVWWLGFDCGHFQDAPREGSYMDLQNKEFEAKHPEWASVDLELTYRDRDYVYNELQGMAQQAAAVVASEELNGT